MSGAARSVFFDKSKGGGEIDFSPPPFFHLAGCSCAGGVISPPAVCVSALTLYHPPLSCDEEAAAGYRRDYGYGDYGD